jgi:hypothetical protein
VISVASLLLLSVIFEISDPASSAACTGQIFSSGKGLSERSYSLPQGLKGQDTSLTNLTMLHIVMCRPSLSRWIKGDGLLNGMRIVLRKSRIIPWKQPGSQCDSSGISCAYICLQVINLQIVKFSVREFLLNGRVHTICSWGIFFVSRPGTGFLFIIISQWLLSEILWYYI